MNANGQIFANGIRQTITGRRCRMERNGKVLDMTQGKPVKMILAFAIPLFIGNIFQQVYSMVDTMVAGYCLGDQAIAAIGATSALYGLIISIAWGLNSGFSLVVTQTFGAHDNSKLRKAIGSMMIIKYYPAGTCNSADSLRLLWYIRATDSNWSIWEPSDQYSLPGKMKAASYMFRVDLFLCSILTTSYIKQRSRRYTKYDI